MIRLATCAIPGIRGRAFGGVPLQPGSNRARQRRRIARHRDGDVTRVHVGVLMQRFDNAAVDVASRALGATVMWLNTPRTPRIC